jgi:hypothetical protein
VQAPGSTLSGLKVIGNIAGDAGGIDLVSGNGQLVNCLVASNVARQGSGLRCLNATPTLTNCTFAKNEGGGLAPGGTILAASSTITVANSVVWGNLGTVLGSSAGGAIVTSYCDVQGGSSGVGDISADPMFVDPAAGDFHLSAGSPCIDAGTDLGAPASDLDAVVRPIDGDSDGAAAFDMGAYESPCTTALDLAAAPTVVSYGAQTTISSHLTTVGSSAIPGQVVTLWRSINGGATWSADGTLAYDAVAAAYRGKRALGQNTMFKTTFAGAPGLAPTTSTARLVRARAYLFRPALRNTRGGLIASAPRGVTVLFDGIMKPRHNGKVSLKFYRRVGGVWMHYRTVTAKLAYRTVGTRYYTTLAFPSAGSWCVRAEHSDATHAPTQSAIKYFTVR